MRADGQPGCGGQLGQEVVAVGFAADARAGSRVSGRWGVGPPDLTLAEHAPIEPGESGLFVEGAGPSGPPPSQPQGCSRPCAYRIPLRTNRPLPTRSAPAPKASSEALPGPPVFGSALGVSAFGASAFAFASGAGAGDGGAEPTGTHLPSAARVNSSGHGWLGAIHPARLPGK